MAELLPKLLVQFTGSVNVSYRDDISSELDAATGGAWKALVAKFPGIRIRRLFRKVDIVDLAKRAQQHDSAYRRTPPTIFVIECASGSQADELYRDLLQWQAVRSVYHDREAVPGACTVGYQTAAPAGIDVPCAQAHAMTSGIVGPLGRTARLVDIEYGWNLGHVAIRDHRIPQSPIGVNDPGNMSHGTSVLGVICGNDPATGFVGIAPGASPRVVSCKPDNATLPTMESTAEAIAYAAANVAADVMLIEMQSGDLFPCETANACFEAIVIATALGITVIEIAGNGNNALDAFQSAPGVFPLRRAGVPAAAYAPFDSGAILVASADSGVVPHTRRANSNFGSRIDCYAWGDGVMTATSSGIADINSFTPPCFVNTSAAGAIVAGAALVIQGALRAKGAQALQPAMLRTLLASAGSGTKPAAADIGTIGVMPDLCKIVSQFAIVPTVPTNTRIIR